MTGYVNMVAMIMMVKKLMGNKWCILHDDKKLPEYV